MTTRERVANNTVLAEDCFPGATAASIGRKKSRQKPQTILDIFA